MGRLQNKKLDKEYVFDLNFDTKFISGGLIEMKKIALMLIVLGVSECFCGYKVSEFYFDSSGTPRAIHYTANGFKANTTYFLKFYVKDGEDRVPIYLDILSKNGEWITPDEDTWHENLPSFTTLDNGYQTGWVYVKNNEKIKVDTYTCAFSVKEEGTGEIMKPGVFRPATVMGDECGWLEGIVRKDGEVCVNSHIVFLDESGMVCGCAKSEPNGIPGDNDLEISGYFKVALPAGTKVATITDWDKNLYDKFEIAYVKPGKNLGVLSNTPVEHPWTVLAGETIILGILQVSKDIVINEIMYNDGNDYEWVELYNKGDGDINLIGLRFIDHSGSYTLQLPEGYGNGTISAKGYAILAKNPGSITAKYNIDTSTVSIFEVAMDLNNDDGATDTLSLCTQDGEEFGTVTYGPGYAGTASAGYSLERISPMVNNWGQSLAAEKATPGLKNSLTSQPKVITLTANPSIVNADDGISTITATVKDHVNEPVANKTVNWTTSGGVLPGASSMTNQDGVAVVTITELREVGTYTIKGTVLQTTPQITIAQVIEGVAIITVIAGTPASITLTADPSTITAGGQSTITAGVTDKWGNATDTTVYWETSGDNLSATSSTTQNGVATVTFTATKTGTYEVTGIITETASHTTTIVVQAGTPIKITLTAPGTVSADIGTATVHGYVTDEHENPVDGTVVYWAGTPTLTTAETSTTQNGTATVYVSGLTKVGTYTITGTVTDEITATTTIFVEPGEPAIIKLVSPKIGTESTMELKIEISDKNENTPEKESVIHWSVDKGTLSSETTTGFGTSTNTLNWTEYGQAVVTATITETIATFTITRTQRFISEGQLDTVTFIVPDGTLTVSGTATKDIYIYVATSIVKPKIPKKKWGDCFEITAYSQNGEKILNEIGTFTIILPVPKNATPIVSTLQIYRSTDTLTWLSISELGKTEAKIHSFSWFTLGGGHIAQETLSDAFAYPNPWKKKDGKKEIIFKKLTKEATIRIFNVAGEEVAKIEKNSETDEVSWTVPGYLASGIYIYLIEAPGVKNKIGKLGIIK